MYHSTKRKRRLVPLYPRHGNQDKFAQAAVMRSNPTPAEIRMWEILTKEVVPNFPRHIFLRQCILFGYILDFYRPTLRPCIEIDGATHDYRKEDDEERDKNLTRYGVEIFRFRNEAVFNTP